MITNIIKTKSKMDIQQTTAMIDIVLALHKLNKAVQRHIAIHSTLFSYFSIFIDYKASKPFLMMLTLSGDSRNPHRPKDSSFDSSIGPIVFQKAIKTDLQASDDYPKCTPFSLSGGLLAALFNCKYHHRGLPNAPLCVEQFLGGLSLHLNHLIAWRAGISFWQFGTLPIGIFLSNLDSRHLMTSPRTLLGQF